ncbi:MAG: hypothetical protein V1853_04645 [bacterium]
MFSRRYDESISNLLPLRHGGLTICACSVMYITLAIFILWGGIDTSSWGIRAGLAAVCFLIALILIYPMAPNGIRPWKYFASVWLLNVRGHKLRIHFCNDTILYQWASRKEAGQKLIWCDSGVCRRQRYIYLDIRLGGWFWPQGDDNSGFWIFFPGHLALSTVLKGWKVRLANQPDWFKDVQLCLIDPEGKKTPPLTLDQLKSVLDYLIKNPVSLDHLIIKLLIELKNTQEREKAWKELVDKVVAGIGLTTRLRTSVEGRKVLGDLVQGKINIIMKR